MSKVETEVQKLTTDEFIELYTLDLRPIGVSSIFYFTNTALNGDGNPILFDGHPYVIVDFKTSGWEYNGQGPFPRPTLEISNVKGFLSGLVYQLQDLVGAKLTRIRTFEKYLDSGSEPDTGKTMPPDLYVVIQKRKQSKHSIEFVLGAASDQQGVQLPRRQILRDTCTHTYRVWDNSTNSFDYSLATCPYNDNVYFNAKGQSVDDPEDDKANYQLKTCCQKRFGKQDLPTRAFPGVVRMKF